MDKRNKETRNKVNRNKAQRIQWIIETLVEAAFPSGGVVSSIIVETLVRVRPRWGLWGAVVCEQDTHSNRYSSGQ